MLLNEKNSIIQWHRQKVTKSREKKSFVEITTKVYNNYLKWHSPPPPHGRSKTHRRDIKISSRKSAARNYDSAYNLAGFTGEREEKQELQKRNGCNGWGGKGKMKRRGRERKK